MLRNILSTSYPPLICNAMMALFEQKKFCSFKSFLKCFSIFECFFHFLFWFFFENFQAEISRTGSLKFERKFLRVKKLHRFEGKKNSKTRVTFFFSYPKNLPLEGTFLRVQKKWSSKKVVKKFVYPQKQNSKIYPTFFSVKNSNLLHQKCQTSKKEKKNSRLLFLKPEKKVSGSKNFRVKKVDEGQKPGVKNLSKIVDEGQKPRCPKKVDTAKNLGSKTHFFTLNIP